MRKLLLPFSWLYGAIVWLRNMLYDNGILPSRKFEQPFTIGIGNLSVGGTGKSPHVAWLAEKLSTSYKIAILSRGYKRKTKGFHLATVHDTSESIGDEPAMYLSRFRGTVMVAVSEDRITGVEKLAAHNSLPDIILLDDVYQHRKIEPAINILLTTYSDPFFNDHLLPAGNLRESASGKERADIIIITKCPNQIAPSKKEELIRKVAPSPEQLLLFSGLKYSAPQPVKNRVNGSLQDLVLLTGIADPSLLITHLKSDFNLLKVFEFPDHHQFSTQEIERVADYFNNIAGAGKAIITTEKDLTRLKRPELSRLVDDLPLYVIRVDVSFSEHDSSALLTFIEQRIHGRTN